MTCRVADSNEDYTGSATYAFTIGRRAAAVKPKNAYYAPAVKWAADNGVTEGIGGLFGRTTTARAQIVTFPYRLYAKA